MSNYGLFDAKNRLSELVERASAGEEVVITKHGKPTVRIVPYASAEDVEARRRRMDESMQKVRAIRESLTHKLTLEDILAGRHEGHKY